MKDIFLNFLKIFPCVSSFTYLNPQLSGISSFNNTSLRDPLLQYSVIIEKFSISVTIPINLAKFMWSRAL